MTTNMTYEQREQYACKVCGNVPDDDGVLSHGRGCYVISEDGGGEEFVEMKAMESEMTTGDAGKSLERLQSMLTDEDKRAMDAYLAKECGHSSGDAGKVIGVPELPNSVGIPVIDDLIVVVINRYPSGYISCPTGVECKWLADLINAVYSPGGLKQQLSDLRQRNSELKEMLRLECVDSCCTDDDIRAEAKKVLSPESVDGDSHGVPGITEIVCMLVKQTADLQQRARELEGELEAEKSNDHWLGEDA